MWLQRNLVQHGERMVSITQVGDPEFLILYIFPLISAVNSDLFIRVILTTTLVDMLNNLLKWFLHGERPYWWIYEAPDNSGMLGLRQFPVTCETGPGSPSGHAMLTTAVWFIILATYVKTIARHSKKKTTLVITIWTLYLTLFTLVSVSRLYIAAHFPHQVIVGGISGLLVGWAFTKLRVSQLQPVHYAFTLIAMLLSIAFAYATLLAFGVDPAWSLALAKKWCAKPEWLRMNATPLSALFRDVGAVAGLALARRLESDTVRLAVVIHRDGREIVTALMSFACVQMCAWVPLPPNPFWLYYMAVLIKYALISFVAVAVVPNIVKISMNLKELPITAETNFKQIIELTKKRRRLNTTDF